MEALSTNRAARDAVVELLERDAELAALSAAVEDARNGTGSLVLIEGEPGIGKTALLAAARQRAADTGVRVLSARGTELEREFPFGAMAQVFGQVVAAHSDELLAGPARLAAPALQLELEALQPRHSETSIDPSFPVLHGLYWVTANLAATGPVLLALDDAHWFDRSSLRFLAFLAPRLEELAVAVVFAVRVGEDAAPRGILDELAAQPHASVVSPGALSPDAVASLVRDALGPDAANEFCSACFDATGGNPFLLGELLAELHGQGVTPAAEVTANIPQVAPAAVSRSVLLRLGRLPTDARGLAQAVAVLGDGADLRRAAAATGLDFRRAGELADALARHHILAPGHPLAFKHPLVRAALYADMGAAARSDTHRRAAALLRDEGSPPEQIAVHLLETEPAGDEATVETLCQAAERSITMGVVERAVAQLERALREPPSPAVRGAVVGALGRAEVLAGNAEAAVAHLQLALEGGAGSPAERVEIARALASALWMLDRPHDGMVALDKVCEELELVDPDRATGLLVHALYAAIRDRSLMAVILPRIAELRERVAPAATAAQRLGLAAFLIVDFALMNTTAAAYCAAVERLHAGDQFLRDVTSESLPWWSSLHYAVRAEAFTFAEEHAQAGLTDARARGSVIGFAYGNSVPSHASLLRGNLAEAAAWAEGCLDITRRHEFVPALPYGATFLIEALVERGEFVRAQRLLEESGFADEIPDSAAGLFVRFTRGRFRLESGDIRRGVDDLLELRRRTRELGFINPAVVPASSLAALGLLRLGECDQARELADDELELSRRSGAPGQIGISLRACGLVEGGDTGIDLLRAAVESLAISRMRLEHARALTDLGAALRRSGRRSDARKALTEGYGLAQACGALALEARARQELLATGARPRRVMRVGAEEITPSERRVAMMAAEGLSNPEIAAALFITTKTVETHLSHVYRKLGISSRMQLARALAANT